jgi:glycosyltransferase involved in cell wall biosynthesis
MMVVESTAGGTFRHVLGLAAGCRRQGLGVHVVCAARRGSAIAAATATLRAAGVEVHELAMRREVRPWQDALAAARLRRLVVDVGPDVLHLHSSKAGALGRAAVAGLNSRPFVVYSPHAYAFLTQKGAARRWTYWCAERALLPWTDCVVAVSESEAAAAARLGGSAPVVAIPNGVDGVTRVERGPGAPARVRIGWLGRLAWQKNPRAAVTISARLSRLGVQHELIIGGDGPAHHEIVAAIRDLGCAASTRVLGFVHDTEAFHAGLDVLLMTSRSEGLPYVGLDAMTHGTPIVAFDAPGVRDLVAHGETGLLAPQGDVHVLANHLVRLARDPQLRRTFGAVARRRVRRQFRFDRQLQAMCALYESHDRQASGRRAVS